MTIRQLNTPKVQHICIEGKCYTFKEETVVNGPGVDDNYVKTTFKATCSFALETLKKAGVSIPQVNNKVVHFSQEERLKALLEGQL